MTMGLAVFLGGSIDELLRANPFASWKFVRSVEDDPKVEFRYEFVERGVEVVCDEADCVQTIFVHRDGCGEPLTEIPFRSTRQQVLSRFGAPTRSGGAVSLPGIGRRGPWDRFSLDGHLVHVQYCVDRDEVEIITLMRPDAIRR